MKSSVLFQHSIQILKLALIFVANLSHPFTPPVRPKYAKNYRAEQRAQHTAAQNATGSLQALRRVGSHR